MNNDFEPLDIYNCPISAQIDQFRMMVQDEYNEQVVKAVGNIGIEIDQQGLIDALNADRKRYSEAYKQGWNDCKKFFMERLDQIAELAGKPVNLDD